MRQVCVALGLCAVAAAVAFSQEGREVKLPPPKMTGGKPLMECLKDRQTIRTFDSVPLPPQTLSDLLWAACGINRPESGKRTAPSAGNRQEIDIYVCLPEGCFVYDPKTVVLRQTLKDDLRAQCGMQEFVKTAPVVLVYVADEARMGARTSSEAKAFYAAADTGFISQNVYLFCASEGLATVVLGMVDKQALAKALNLRPEQKVILTQPVGYPKR